MSEHAKGGLLRTGRLAELGLLTATLTHELRQPLFAIRSLAQLALSNSDRAPAHLEELVRQTELMDHIIGAVSNYARDDTGILSPVDVGGVVEQVVNLLRHRAKHRSIRIDVERHGEIGPVVGEPTALLQVLVNLVQNAIDASPDEGRVVVSLHAAESGLEVRVKDEGPGISQDIQDQVFEAFFTTKGPEKGTGLGLYLARELVEVCRGEIDVEPSEQGACLRLSLRGWTTP